MLELVGCAHTVSQNKSMAPALEKSNATRPHTHQMANIDPYEKFNRAVFKFNMGFNKAILDPTIGAYNRAVPGRGRLGIHNFFENIQTVPTICNDLFQANFRYAGRDTERLILNTTLGIGGLVDVASDVGLYPRTQSFGLTLAKWGVRETPYLVLPVIGPTTVAGAVGMVPDFYLSPVNYFHGGDGWQYYSVKGVQYLQLASEVLPKIQFITQDALDPYVAMRNAYLQNRRYILEKIDNETPDDNVAQPKERGPSFTAEGSSPTQRKSTSTLAEAHTESNKSNPSYLLNT